MLPVLLQGGTKVWLTIEQVIKLVGLMRMLVKSDFGLSVLDHKDTPFP